MVGLSPFNSIPFCRLFPIVLDSNEENFISLRWQFTPLPNVITSRMMDENRRSVVYLAGLAAAADVLLSSDDEGAHADRDSSYPRVRTTFVDATKYLSEVEFTRAFRMSPDCFGKLLLLLRVRLERDERQGYRTSGGVVEPAVRLGLTLRILAGASYLDMMHKFRVAKSTVFDIFWDTVQAIYECISLPALPFGNTDELRRMSIDFTNSRSPLALCMAALEHLMRSC
jgi:hypothetical protein